MYHGTHHKTKAGNVERTDGSMAQTILAKGVKKRRPGDNRDVSTTIDKPIYNNPGQHRTSY